MLSQKAIGGVSFQDRFFPKPQRALLRFKTLDETPDRLQQVEINLIASLEELMFFGSRENVGRNTFFENNRAGTVLAVIDFGLALPFELQ